jgi:uncharacterized membrane protein
MQTETQVLPIRQPTQGSAATATATATGPSSAQSFRGPRKITRKRLTPMASDAPLPTGLGWLSLALGATQLLAPRLLSRAIGAPDHPVLMRAIGMRELTAGIGILTQRRMSPWLWSRVAGDVMDLALLAGAARSRDADVGRLAVAAFAVAGVTALDVQAGRRRSQLEGLSQTGQVRIDECIAINRPPEACYRFWRDFEKLPQFMKNLESVRQLDRQRSHWVADVAGGRFEWDSEILKDEPNQLIVWHTLPGADVPHAGTVSFEPGPAGRGTLVRVEMEYRPPGGKAFAVFAQLFGVVPANQVREDLRRFKQILETGEIPTTVGQPAGQRSTLGRLLKKGQPG